MWYYEQNGQAMGPVNTTILSTLVSSGVVQPQTQVCREGESAWNPAYQTELASLFSKTALSWVDSPTPEQPALPGQAWRQPEPLYHPSDRRSIGKDISSLTMGLKVLLGVGVFASFVGIMSAWAENDILTDLINGVYANEEQAFAANSGNFLVESFLNTILGVVNFGTIIFFAIWIYQASANAWRLSERKLKYSPAWAVGWYFIPIAHLYKPYEAMKEIFEVSTTTRFRRTQSTTIVNLWWMFWIVSSLSWFYTLTRYVGVRTYEALQTVNLIAMASHCLDIVLCLIAIIMIGQIADGQQSQSRYTPTVRPKPVAPFRQV